MAVVKKNDKYGLINKEGKEVIECIYDDIYDFHEGLAVVKKNKKYGYVDKEGKEVIECIYDDVSDFHEGMASVEKNGMLSYIDKTGKEVSILNLGDLQINRCKYLDGQNFGIFLEDGYSLFNPNMVLEMEKEKVSFLIKFIMNLTDFFDKSRVFIAVDLRTRTIQKVEKWDKIACDEQKLMVRDGLIKSLDKTI